MENPLKYYAALRDPRVKPPVSFRDPRLPVRDLTENQIRRGVFTGVEQLQSSIFGDIEQHNIQPKPFIWTAKATDILEKVKRGEAALLNCLSA